MKILKRFLILPIIMTSSGTWAVGDNTSENRMATVSPFALQPQHPFVKNQVMVKFKEEGIQSLDVISIQESLGVFNVQTFSLTGTQLWKMTQDTVTAMRMLKSDPRIEYIEPNYIITVKQMPTQERNCGK